MKKGFTLIELLIVIGILAILATATILVLNPAQLFAQARDSQRISDLSALKSAISFYLATAASPLLAPGTAGNTCGTNYWSSTSSPSVVNYVIASSRSTQSGVLAVDGTGWVPVVLGNASGGSPLAALPRDPINDATYNYQYSCGTVGGQYDKTFELDAKIESARYGPGGSNDVVTTDGGNSATTYEVGTAPGLAL